MTNINHQLLMAAIPSGQFSAQVTHCFEDGSLMVESEGRGWHCRRAVSCVIAPQAGDTVLISAVDNQMWLLAVLERQNTASAAELSVQGDRSGRLMRYQMAYIAGRNTSVIMVPPSVPPISV